MIDLRDKLNKVIDRQGLRADRKKLALVVIISLVVIYLDCAFVLSAQLKWLSKTGAKIAQIKKEMGEFRKDSELMQNYKKNNIRLTAAAAKVKKAISETEIPDFLEEVSRLANFHNVRIVQINPLRDSRENKETQAPFLKTTISIDAKANYHRLGSFINSLENMNELVLVEEMKIARDPKDYMLLDAALTIKTYVKK